MSVDGPLRVPYNIPGSPQWQWVNIYTRMSIERIIFINRPITDGLANSIISSMLYLDSDDPGKPIYLYINSIGDPVAMGMASPTMGMSSVMATLAIYDTMRHISSEVATICLGQAVGVAALLLSSGTKGKRASLPHASLALSHPYSGTQGQASDIEINARHVLDKRHAVVDIFAENTGQSPEKIAKDMERTFYMTPYEAQEYGLVDRVLESPKEAIAPQLQASS
ncbi:MAG: ATP-dependent Clp protease proteolytic subunit [Leptolyngbyaceae bacterium]|nr:ATP-dependent Clp protease proteolytic subunit [Leptolyngbyaceae bacterium]